MEENKIFWFENFEKFLSAKTVHLIFSAWNYSPYYRFKKSNISLEAQSLIYSGRHRQIAINMMCVNLGGVTSQRSESPGKNIFYQSAESRKPDVANAVRRQRLFTY